MTEDIHEYIARKRYLGVHGNHLEIQALSEMYNRPIHIYCYSAEPINMFQVSLLKNMSNDRSGKFYFFIRNTTSNRYFYLYSVHSGYCEFNDSETIYLNKIIGKSLLELWVTTFLPN